MDVPTIVVKPGEGRSVWLGGMGVVFKVSGADTGGAFAVVEHPIEPGRLVLPHVHLHEDEYSYVLEGTIGARVGDHEVAAGPGSYLFKPRGLMHTFWNAGPGPARILEVIAPAGYYFAELAGAGDPGRRPELAAQSFSICDMAARWARPASAVDISGFTASLTLAVTSSILTS